MRTFNRILTTVGLGLSLVAAGCAGQTSVASSGVAPVSAPAASINVSVPRDNGLQTLPVNEAGEPLAARVNGAEITQQTFERALARYEQQMFASDAAMQQMVLDALIDQVLIDQAAAAQDIEISDEEVQAELDANKQIAGDDATWQTWLNNNMYTEDEFRETLRETLLTGRMRDLITENLDGAVPHVHARHIVVATEAEASALLERLSAGEDFAAIAAAHSNDVTTRDTGGDLGWFAQGELLEPYLAQVAFSTPVGEVAGPVATTLGYHIVQTLGREDRTIPEEKRAVLAQFQFEAWIQTLRGRAIIEVY